MHKKCLPLSVEIFEVRFYLVLLELIFLKVSIFGIECHWIYLNMSSKYNILDLVFFNLIF